MTLTINAHVELVELLSPRPNRNEEQGARLGGKGAALARLVDGGFPVPATGVVTTASFDAVAPAIEIAACIAAIQAGEPMTAEEVDAVFATAPVAPEVEQQVVELARSVSPGGRLAVRSSATVEDLEGSSFAGQYRSLLDVPSDDADAVMTAVRQVWASLWHPAPTAYRRAFGVDETDVAMAVVLMEMIPATTAGVIFTADPAGSDGARVEQVDGLGEALVSGQTTPSAWVVPHDGSGPEIPRAAADALRLALEIETAFGCPQDIEWAAIDDEVAIVQARPITTLDDQDGFDSPLDQHELTTAGIVEMVPGVLPPLRWDLNSYLLEEAFRSVLASLGIIRGADAEARPFVRRVRGRVAIDFDLLREAAAHIPGAVQELEYQYFGEASPTGADSSDAGTDTDIPATPNSSDTDRRWNRLETLAADLRLIQTRSKVIDQADVVTATSRALRTQRPLLVSWSDADVLAYGQRLLDLAARGLAAELGVAAAGAAAHERLGAQLRKYLPKDQADRAVLATTAHTNAERARQPFASAAIFAGPTWRELETEPPTSLPHDPEAAEAAVEDLESTLKGQPGWRRTRILTGQFIDVRVHLVRRIIADVTQQIRRREETKAAVLELGGEMRRVHLEIGRRLVERGALEVPTDVEFLSAAELEDATDPATGDPTLVIAEDTIRRRKRWAARYEAEGALPVRFTGEPIRDPEPLPDGDVVEGWSASAGRARGRARVVRQPTDRFEAGEVLVAEATDASWSPLFVRAAAIVVERGGPLSHAAILARELGLPAVLNVPGATGGLEGCVVSVDGDQGLVVIEERPQ